MSPSANVLSIQALQDLKASLSRFSSETTDSLNAAAQEIRKTLDWLAERENHWRNEVQRRREDERCAEIALARCKTSGFRDQEGRYHPPDCSAHETALQQSQARLRDGENELRNVQQWIGQVEKAGADYQRQAQRLGNMLSTELPKASAFLEQKMADLERYRAVAPPAADRERVSSNQTPTVLPPSTTAGITWAEYRGILKKIDDGLPITIEDLQSLKLPIADLEAGTVEDNGWIEQLVESERYGEAMKASREAEDLRGALLATLKAIQALRE